MEALHKILQIFSTAEGESPIFRDMLRALPGRSRDLVLSSEVLSASQSILLHAPPKCGLADP